MSKKVIEQRQEVEIRIAWIKKASKKIDNDLSDQHKHDNYNINKWQNIQSNNKANLDEIDNLNIS